MSALSKDLRELIRLSNLQVSFRDALGHERRASQPAVISALGALHDGLTSANDVPDVLHEVKKTAHGRVIEPVTVSWIPSRVQLDLAVQPSGESSSYELVITSEAGEAVRLSGAVRTLETLGEREFDGTRYCEKRLTVDHDLPAGIYRVRWTIGEAVAEGFLFRAHERAYGKGERGWGAFAPTYALKSKRSAGIGDLMDLERLGDWIRARGGAFVGTLPLSATSTESPYPPSPYSPISRRFWNELYLDLDSIPELEGCTRARRMLESQEAQQLVSSMNAQEHVDFPKVVQFKRRLIEELSRHFFQEPSMRIHRFEAFLAANPGVKDYAAFRAVESGRGAPWPAWPLPLREGIISQWDYDPTRAQYHLYAQWILHEQLEQLSARFRDFRLRLYLDFPVGVSADGYDVWRDRASFALGVNVGAPPDAFFAKGQDWGFSPPHPERTRALGYKYLAECLRAQMRFASLLRIDHVMGVHRLYWIPPGFDATDGVYVKYRPEEVYALLSIESYRARSTLVGEDLGTVPREVRPAMQRHGLRGMYVLQFDVDADREETLGRPGANCVASLNTHDTPTFAGFATGTELDDRRALGMIDDAELASARTQRARARHALSAYLQSKGLLHDVDDLQALMQAAYRHLGSTDAEWVVVNLEDLWLELSPQNVPGTTVERSNWSRRMKQSLESLQESSEYNAFFDALGRDRQKVES